MGNNLFYTVFIKPITGTFYLAFLLFVVFHYSCIPSEKQPTKSIRFDFNDRGVRSILLQQDRQALDSLYIWFEHDDPTYRYYAVRALASVGDSSSISFILPLLNDKDPEVRLAAIKALGQIGSEKATMPLLAAFDPWDSLGTSAKMNAAILASTGKMASAQYLSSMSSVKTYELADSLYLEGQAKGIFYFCRRGHTDPLATSRMAAMLVNEQASPIARFYAGSYLSRAPDIRLDTLILEMVNALRSEQNPEFRIVLAQAVGRSTNALAKSSLIGLFPLEKDYRVRIAMLKGLARHDYLSIRETLEKGIRDSIFHVGMVAAEVLLKVGDPKDSPDWLMFTRTIKDPWIKVQLYHTLSRMCPVYLPATRSAIQLDIRQAMNATSNNYLKGAYIKALGEFGWNVAILREEWARNRHPYIKTSAIESLQMLSDRSDFNIIFGEAARSIRRNLADFFVLAIESRDPGSVAIAAMSLRNASGVYRPLVKADSVFIKALAACTLPQEIETYNELLATQAFFKNNVYNPAKALYNHPIDWTLLDQVKDKTRAIIKTNRGNIILQLFVEYTPGTVSNFIQLATSGYYNNKVFHRVVPGFVIQGGCPRGDGFGSLNYTIRSEVAESIYDQEGLVGMASAGLHTEGVQFFITHAPTPHLDGKYTCFGRVESGMEVVHAMRQGDTIESVEIIY